MDIIYYYNCR